jgi:hypothetical protein
MAEASEEGQGPRRAVETMMMMMMMITAHEYPTIRRGHVPLKKSGRILNGRIMRYVFP